MGRTRAALRNDTDTDEASLLPDEDADPSPGSDLDTDDSSDEDDDVQERRAAGQRSGAVEDQASEASGGEVDIFPVGPHNRYRYPRTTEEEKGAEADADDPPGPVAYTLYTVLPIMGPDNTGELEIHEEQEEHRSDPTEDSSTSTESDDLEDSCSQSTSSADNDSDYLPSDEQPDGHDSDATVAYDTSSI